MAPVLFILAHPDLVVSRANKALAAAAARVDDVIVHDLYATYPDMFVDGTAERQRLAQCSAIVLQHPIYWYAAPSLLKEWFDRTLTAGWAYGKGGDTLKGKKLLSSITTGSDYNAYAAEGTHGNPVDDYLKPYRQTALFCGMEWQDPLIFHHARAESDDNLNRHAELLAKRLQTLASGG